MEAEPAIQQLLKLDFEPKSRQLFENFPPNYQPNSQNSCVASWTIGRYDFATIQSCSCLFGTNTEEEAEDKIANNRLQSTVDQKIEAYNQVVSGINSLGDAVAEIYCSVSNAVWRHQWFQFVPVSPEPESAQMV